MTILDQLAEHAGERVSEAKRKISPKDLKQQALSMQKGSFAFENALRKDGISFICECKKGADRTGVSVFTDRRRIRGGRCRLHFRADRTKMVSWKQ